MGGLASLSGRSRLLLGAVVVLASAVALSACGGDDDDDGGGEREEVSVGVTTIGPRNDKAFSQAHVEGAELAAEETPGVEVTAVLDNREAPQDRIDALETLAESNDLVIGGSASFAPSADTVAPQFPETWFVVNGGGLTASLLDNVTAFVLEQGLPAYVAGVVAADLSESGVVGYVGGAEIPPTEQAGAGFAEGAEEQDPDVEVQQNIVGNFNDAAKAKEAATAMIDDGADYLYAFLDAGITGVYQAAEESGEDVGVFNINVLECESYDNIVGTGTQNNQLVISRAIEQFKDGALEPGAVFLGLQDPEIQTLELCPEYADDEQVAKLTEETIQRLNDGDITPSNDVITPPPDYEFSEGFGGGE